MDRRGLQRGCKDSQPGLAREKLPKSKCISIVGLFHRLSKRYVQMYGDLLREREERERERERYIYIYICTHIYIYTHVHMCTHEKSCVYVQAN